MSKELWILMVAFCSLLGSVGQIFFKKAAGNIFSIYFIVAIIFYGTAAIIYALALKHLPLSVAYPIISLSYAFVLIFSYLFFKEAITMTKILGVILIILGITFISF